jgi:hypothetical protein
MASRRTRRFIYLLKRRALFDLGAARKFASGSIGFHALGAFFLVTRTYLYTRATAH